jgi:hypothetical protein
MGDPDGAPRCRQAHIDAAEREPAHYAPDHLNLVFLHASRRRSAAAIAALDAAERADPTYLRQHLGGFIGAALADPGPADPALWSALAATARRLGLEQPARAAAARAAATP